MNPQTLRAGASDLVALSVCIAVTALAVARAQTPAAPIVAEISASRHILVRWSDGSVVAMGENRSGQAARPKIIRAFVPGQRVDLPSKAIQVLASEDTSYAVLTDGSVWAWGRGFNRELGVDLKGATERETPAVIPGLRDVLQVSGSGTTAIALLRDGTVRAWGELPPAFTGGNRVYPGTAEPVELPGLKNIVAVAGGALYGLALTRDGHVWAWGPNDHGQLGLPRKTDAFAPPAEVPGLQDVVSIARLVSTGAAITRDGRVWTWGHNQQGGLGDGQRADVSDASYQKPQPVKGITDAVEVRAGASGRHVIVRRRGGTLIGWGNSDWGQLGAGISGDFQLMPTPIKLAGVEALWLGGNFSFARTTGGAVWFWGEEWAARGLLGVRGNQRLPVKVPIEKLQAPGTNNVGTAR